MPAIEFENKIGRRFRMWLDDLPSDVLISNETVCETRTFKAGLAPARRKRIAIEIFQSLGASFHYGLLGGEYRATTGSALEVTIPLDTPFPHRHYANSLARSLDVVTIGGLPEYADAIYTAIEQANIDVLPSGFLNITCMAHGEIGSAPTIFGSLARALIVSLCRSDQPGTLDDAMKLLAA